MEQNGLLVACAHLCRPALLFECALCKYWQYHPDFISLRWSVHFCAWECLHFMYYYGLPGCVYICLCACPVMIQPILHVYFKIFYKVNVGTIICTTRQRKLKWRVGGYALCWRMQSKSLAGWDTRFLAWSLQSPLSHVTFCVYSF